MSQPDPLLLALRRLNDAVYAALRAGRDTSLYPMLNRQALRDMATVSDNLVDDHVAEAAKKERSE